VDSDPQGKGGPWLLSSLSMKILARAIIQPELSFHNAEVARQWSVRSLHFNHHEFFHAACRSFLACPLPAHLQAGQTPVRSPYLVDQQLPKKQKKGTPASTAPDFISSTPLCQLTAALPANANLITLALRAMPPGKRVPRLIDTAGESLICFRSICPSPPNRCRMSTCGSASKRRTRLLPVLHINQEQSRFYAPAQPPYDMCVPFLKTNFLHRISHNLPPAPRLWQSEILDISTWTSHLYIPTTVNCHNRNSCTM
jgi:hypothetical protein